VNLLKVNAPPARTRDSARAESTARPIMVPIESSYAISFNHIWYIAKI